MSDAQKVRKGDGRRQRGNRSGFTTGACSAAAARAATLGLLSGEVPASVVCHLPNGQDVSFPVIEGRIENGCAHAVIVKDAGDDPDATNGAHLTADVRLLPNAAGEIVLKGGPGVGVVTKEGLGLEVNGPAINPVPRRNIADNVRAVAGELLDHDGLEVTISVPGGDAMAKKTLNARLGILGGRPTSLRGAARQQAALVWADASLSAKDAALKIGIPVRTAYRLLGSRGGEKPPGKGGK